MTISSKIREQVAQSSWIRRMFEIGHVMKSEFGEKNVFDLSLGNPVAEPPKAVFDELARLAQDKTPGMHRYMENAGYRETRASVAQYLKTELDLDYTFSDIVMTSGTSCSLSIVLKSLVGAQDEVIILAPYFGYYTYPILNSGGLPVIVNTNKTFHLDIDAIRGAITKDTCCIILNSPNNPTGAVYSENELKALSELLQEKQKEFSRIITVLSDEVYNKILFNQMPYPSMSKYYDHTIIATSFSKDMCLPGERIGYVAIHPNYPEKPELGKALVFCMQSLGFTNAPALMQRLVTNLMDLPIDVFAYQHKRDVLYKGLKDLGYELQEPEGAFYILLKSPYQDEMEFVQVLQKQKTLVVPGMGFGAPGYVRLAYCVDDWVIEGALKGFAEVAAELKLGQPS